MTTASMQPSHDRLAALYEATRAIAEQLSLDRTLATVIEATRQLFAADRAAVFHVDEAGNSVCLASFGLSAGFIEVFSRLGTTAPVARRMLAARSPVLVEDALALAPNDSIGAAMAAEGFRTVLALPMLRGGDLSGSLVIYHDRRRRYSGEEIQVAEALVGQAAIAIDNARLHELAELRAREAQAIYEASKRIMSSLDLTATLDSILDSIIRLCDADLSGVLLVDDDGAALRCVAARGALASQILGGSLRLGQGLSGLAAQTGQVMNSPDIEHDARWVRRNNADLAGIRSALSVPVCDRERVIAVLTAHSRHLAHFTPARERLLVILAEQAALAILHAREVAGRRRAEESQRFLSEASSLLAASLDEELTLQSVAHLAVPYLADCCLVDVIEEGEPTRRVAVAHVDPAKEEVARELNRHYPQSPATTSAVSTVLRTGRPIVLPEVSEQYLGTIARDDEHRRLLLALDQTTYMAVPLAARGRVIGAIAFSSTNPDRRYGPADLALAEELARRAALAVDNARLYREVTAREQQLQELVGRLFVAQEEERRRIAYDVHDGLAQIATSAHQHLQAFALHHRPRSPRAREGLARAVELAQTTVREARRVIADLRPTTLDDFGLAAALRLQVEQLHAEGWQVAYDEALEGDRLPAALETALFRVAQEALTNVRKHARTTRVCVGLVRDGQSVRLEVQDWGCGFDPNGTGPAARPGEHVGLAGMRERITLLGGRFCLESRLAVGTRVVAEVPLPAAPQKA